MFTISFMSQHSKSETDHGTAMNIRANITISSWSNSKSTDLRDSGTISPTSEVHVKERTSLQIKSSIQHLKCGYHDRWGTCWFQQVVLSSAKASFNPQRLKQSASSLRQIFYTSPCYTTQNQTAEGSN